MPRINEGDYTAPAPRDPAQVRLETIQEATRAATTTVNNALRNAGMLTPAQKSVESARESGKFQAPVKQPLTSQKTGTGTGTGTKTGAGGGGTAGTAGGAVPGATGLSATGITTLAIDTFKNTLALFFGKEEMSKSWVNALYNSVSSFYKTGSTIDEALNLSLQDVRRNPELKPFTDRFKGLYALQDRLAKGEAIQVPTIAEFFKAESDMGDVMRAAGLGDLATQEFLGNILGTGKSVREVGNIISDVFTTIDNAPKALKDTLSTYFPGVDRVSLAKALLTGPEGAAELSKKVKQVSVLSAAKTQGLDVSMQTAGDIAAQGYGYQESLAGFGQIARELPTYQKLQEIETGGKISAGQVQGQLQTAVFGRDIQQQLAIEAAAQREANRFRGQAGAIGSRSLASQNRGQI